MSSQYRKSEKPKVLSYLPTKEYGQEGDTVVVRMSGKGVFFCVKAAGIWYAQTTMQPLSKINTAYIKDLQSDKLTLKKIINAGLNTNKFLVLKDNSIKYRTGDDILDDLNVFASKKINFKTAYCSLGQYSDKESCETNGGTWYYSENDSHDSISSTPENQLLTTGQTIGTMDSESTLLYDGSTLEIKYNSDYDDNWQTSAQTGLLKLSYDSDNFGSIGMLSSGGMTFVVEEGNSFAFYEKQASGIASIRMSINADTGILKLQNPDNILDSFTIDIDDNAATTIKTYDSGSAVGHITLQPDGDLILDPASTKTIINATDGLYFDGGTHTHISESSSDNLRFTVGGTILLDLTEAVTNSVNVNAATLVVDSQKPIYLDGGGDTYIVESSADVLDVKVGDDMIFQITESGADGNTIDIDNACVGFTQLEPTYDASNTVVDFRHSNKQNLTFGAGSITNVQLFFPLVSGNFQLLVKQDGTGSRTITNYKVYEFDESLADGENTAKWAGGSAPTLTTDANHVDILSFYWDADNEIAYGVATLDFQF